MESFSRSKINDLESESNCCINKKVKLTKNARIVEVMVISTSYDSTTGVGIEAFESVSPVSKGDSRGRSNIRSWIQQS